MPANIEIIIVDSKLNKINLGVNSFLLHAYFFSKNIKVKPAPMSISKKRIM